MPIECRSTTYFIGDPDILSKTCNTIIYASMQQAVPGPLAGSADFPLPPGAKKFEIWDKQDGLRGLWNIISRGGS
jgi:hypothetical protein